MTCWSGLDRPGTSQLDLCKGYWQVPLDLNPKPLTTFRTPVGLYQFTVLPFGLHGRFEEGSLILPGSSGLVLPIHTRLFYSGRTVNGLTDRNRKEPGRVNRGLQKVIQCLEGQSVF